MKRTPITQEMLTAVGEPIKSAFTSHDTQGLVFVEVFGGKFTVYSPELKQALRGRYSSIQCMRQHLISKGVMERVK